MAVDMFLKIEGVDGESLDSSHAGEIDVLAWSFGVSQSGSMHMGGGGGAGKANFQDLSVTKYVDKSSPTLMLKAATGAHIASAQLTVRKAGGEQQEYLLYKLTNLLISSVSTGGSGGEDRLTENITINFEKIEVNYFPQKEDGSLDASVDFIWDIPANQS